MEKWKEHVIYQIWPRSFKDSNGDGIGDLGGIIEKLDYLAELGITMLWLSPVYLSPNKDYGYDISDYYQINPEFGTMEDFDNLVTAAKVRGISIMMDLVANHTSDQHIWFQEALHNPNSPYRAYYYFEKGKDDGPPNNWMSFFGGSAWTYDVRSKMYYLTQFTPNQCDLNWQNPNVREAFYKIMRFWLAKGVKGFRMDVINAIAKVEGLGDKDAEKKGLQFPRELTLNRQETHIYLQEMYKEVVEPYECVAVGEGPLATPADVIRYTKPERKELHMMMHFDLHNLGYGELGKYDFRKLYRWRLTDFKKVLYNWQETMQDEEGWTGNYLSNHDQNRQVSRFGDDREYRVESAKALCLLNLTLRGTPFIYQGEEIGMTDCKLEIEEWRDYEALNAYKVLQSMMHVPKGVAKHIVQKVTRDNSRTPMQWSDCPYAGFSVVEPWIKVNPNYQKVNVVSDQLAEASIFKFYKEVIAFRREHAVLINGGFEGVIKNHRQVVAYIRRGREMGLLVVINLSRREAMVAKDEIGYETTYLVYNTHPMAHHIELEGELTLRPYEARIYRV